MYNVSSEISSSSSPPALLALLLSVLSVGEGDRFARFLPRLFGELPCLSLLLPSRLFKVLRVVGPLGDAAAVSDFDTFRGLAADDDADDDEEEDEDEEEEEDTGGTAVATATATYV